MLRVGVAASLRRAVHVPAFRADERCRVVGIGAATAGRAREAATALGIERAFDDWQELVASPDLDVVAIAVPPAVQPAVAEAAARAGKHIFCEKPWTRGPSGGTDGGGGGGGESHAWDRLLLP